MANCKQTNLRHKKKRKKLVCRSDLMNEKMITKTGDGSVSG